MLLSIVRKLFIKDGFKTVYIGVGVKQNCAFEAMRPSLPKTGRAQFSFGQCTGRIAAVTIDASMLNIHQQQTPTLAAGVCFVIKCTSAYPIKF